MKHSPTWEADGLLASQIIRLLENPKFITEFTRAQI
jgi:hypothetical protein